MSEEHVLVSRAKFNQLMKSMNTENTDAKIEPQVKTPNDFKDGIQTALNHVTPNKFKSLAIGLYEFLKLHRGSEINWNEDGKLILDNEEPSNTNIVDLIKNVVSNERGFRPPGHDQFIKILEKINTPKSFITIKQRQNKKRETPDKRSLMKRRKKDQQDSINLFFEKRRQNKKREPFDNQTGKGSIFMKESHNGPPGIRSSKIQKQKHSQWIKF